MSLKLIKKVSLNFINILRFMGPLTDFLINNGFYYFRIFTHVTIAERLLLYKLALTLKDNSTLVEIGSYLGGSSSFLACAAQTKNHKLYCVDTWGNESMTEGLRDTYNIFMHNIKPVKDYVFPLRGKSADIANSFHYSIDLLFVDGDHSYESVKLDVESWLPKLKDGGIIILHDYAWAEGVKKIVEESIKPIKLEEHILQNIYWAKVYKHE
jgi:predicted O-methyltransferase YrrM